MSKPSVVVLDYGIGNLRSAQKALERVGADAVLTADARIAASADAVVLPGVGAFGACMNALRAAGLESVVHDVVDQGKPFMGICVGMQLLASRGVEHGVTPGLDWIGGEVVRITPADPAPAAHKSQASQTAKRDSRVRGNDIIFFNYILFSL